MTPIIGRLLHVITILILMEDLNGAKNLYIKSLRGWCGGDNLWRTI